MSKKEQKSRIHIFTVDLKIKMFNKENLSYLYLYFISIYENKLWVFFHTSYNPI